MYKFCTLFDKNYLYKGLALYFSLLKHSSGFHLWVLCMDDLTFSLLERMNLKGVSLIPMAEFENEKLLAVKKERTVAEYSWTCTANLCWYMMDIIQDSEMITYLDADMYFFADPKNIFQETGDKSIAIVGHRLEGERKRLEKYVGKYNVGWISFRKDKNGLASCEWWKERVLEWCYARFEKGKIGDQHYLNDWPERFQNVRVIGHEGADVAPWNVANREVSIRDNKVFIGGAPLVFYHFHNFIIINENFYIPASAYHIPASVRKFIYERYFQEMKEAIKFTAKTDYSFSSGFKKKFLKSYMAHLLFKFKFFDSLYIKYSHYNLEKLYG